MAQTNNFQAASKGFTHTWIGAQKLDMPQMLSNFEDYLLRLQHFNKISKFQFYKCDFEPAYSSSYRPVENASNYRYLCPYVRRCDCMPLTAGMVEISYLLISSEKNSGKNYNLTALP